MKRRFTCDDNQGISSAVTVMFLIAGVSLIYASLMGYYYPQYAKANEYNHMLYVQNRFLEIQSTVIDELHSTMEGETVAVPIKLGSITRLKSIQIIELPTSAGSIVLNTSNDMFSATMMNTDDSTYIFSEVGSLVYTSYNTYYPPQRLYYQGGAVLKRQGDSSTMVSPGGMDFYVTREQLNPDSGNTYLYYSSGSTGDTYAVEVDFSVPGRPGDITVSYQSIHISDGEVGVFVNNVDTGIRLPPQNATTWSSTLTFTIKDEYFRDGGINVVSFVNIFNQNAGSPYPYSWGIRYVNINSDFVRITMPVISLLGDQTGVAGLGVAVVNLKHTGSEFTSYRPGERHNYTLTINAGETADGWYKYINTTLHSSGLVAGLDFSVSLSGTTITVVLKNIDEISLEKGVVEVDIR